MKRIIIIILLVSVSKVYSISPDQTLVERSLNDNRYFIEILDVSVSNFGNENQKKRLIETNKINFEANLDYLQGFYVESYKKIKKSQKLLRDLYAEILDIYIIDSRKLLNKTAPVIVMARDKKAKLFLKLGYRDLKAANKFKIMGYNYNKFLYSNKIRFYIDGIKRARRAKRFSFLALIESKTPFEEKKEYKTQTIDEAFHKEIEIDKVSDYEKIKNKLLNMLSRKLFENSNNFFLHHDDNYNLIEKSKSSVINSSVEELRKTITPLENPDNKKKDKTQGNESSTTKEN